MLPLCTAATPATDVPLVQDAVDDVTTLEQAASSELPDVGGTEVERSPTEDGTLCSTSCSAFTLRGFRFSMFG